MLKALIIDDEKRSRESLQHVLEENCPEIEIVGQADSVATGVESINKLQPDLLFLDIEMQDGTGFDLLEQVRGEQFDVIFTTAFENYALKALKMSAVDYLLKPIGDEELGDAVSKVVNKKTEKSSEKNFELLLQNLNSQSGNHKIALPTSEGLSFINVRDIIRCKADGSYTHFYFKDGTTFLVSKKIKEYEELLSPYHFQRVHHSHLINLDEVKKYVRGDGGYVVMSDGETVYVSKRKKEGFLSALNKA